MLPELIMKGHLHTEDAITSFQRTSQKVRQLWMRWGRSGGKWWTCLPLAEGDSAARM